MSHSLRLVASEEQCEFSNKQDKQDKQIKHVKACIRHYSPPVVPPLNPKGPKEDLHLTAKS